MNSALVECQSGAGHVDSTPGIGSWMYTSSSEEALASGARILMVQEPIYALRRVVPDPTIIAWTVAGAERMEAVREIRVTSAHYGICCPHCSLWLDGDLIVGDGRLLVPVDATG
jgi:hypothetical protein